jgi:hypothetical protein
MQKGKLQIFLSSTYENLIDQRLAAMEGILAAGHIPAAMEQFSPGDESELRAKAVPPETFSGLSYDELVGLLSQIHVSEVEAANVLESFGMPSKIRAKTATNLLLLFDAIYDEAAGGRRVWEDRPSPPVAKLLGFGLLERRRVEGFAPQTYEYSVTGTGQRLRTRFFAHRLINAMEQPPSHEG